MMRSAVVIGTTLVGLAAGVRGDTLATWTFEVSQPFGSNVQDVGPFAAEDGLNAAGSFASGHHASDKTDYSNPTGNGSAESFSSTEWAIGDYYQFTTATTGYKDVTISWDQTRSATGPDTFDVEWSTDGVGFTTLVDNYTVLLNSTDNGGEWDAKKYIANYNFPPVSGPADLNGQVVVYFRFTNQVDPASTAGTNRLDNVTIAGTPDGGPPPCYPDFDGNGSLDLFDFLAFVNAFNAGDARADCDNNGVFDLFDFLCFVNAFNAGC